MVVFETTKGSRIIKTIDIYENHDPAKWAYLPHRYEQYAQGDGYPDYSLAMTYPAMFPVCELEKKHYELCELVGIKQPIWKRFLQWLTMFNSCTEKTH